MNAIAIEQVTSIELLVVFLFGVTFGVIGGAVYGSRHGALLVPSADGLLSAGARVIYGVYTRDDDGYLQRLLASKVQPSGDLSEDDSFESRGQEVER